MIQEPKEITYGEVLRLYRIAADLKVIEMSERTGISKSYIAEIECGKRNNPTKMVIEGYSQATGVPEGTIYSTVLKYVGRELTYQKLLSIILRQVMKGGNDA